MCFVCTFSYTESQVGEKNTCLVRMVFRNNGTDKALSEYLLAIRFIVKVKEKKICKRKLHQKEIVFMQCVFIIKYVSTHLIGVLNLRAWQNLPLLSWGVNKKLWSVGREAQPFSLALSKLHCYPILHTPSPLPAS